MFSDLMKNKMFKILLVGVVIFIVIILVVFFASRFKSDRFSSFEALETKVLDVAKDYFEEYAPRLPNGIGSTTEVSVATLVSENYIQDLSEIAPEGAVCDGKVIVKNVNGNHFYQVYLDCGASYKTQNLHDYILGRENVVASGTGLYQNTDGYYYRGENPNNYVIYARKIYRIVRINNDGTMDIIATKKRDKNVWDDRYNQDRNGNSGINDYSISRIKDALLAFINSAVFEDEERLMLEPYSLCVGKVAQNSELQLGQECATTIQNQIIGLLPLSYYMYASLDSLCTTPLSGNCQNYNYLASYDYNWWTITGLYDSSYQAYLVNSYSSASISRTSSSYMMREVLRITDQVVYVSGNGTENSPYIIK